MMNEFIMWWSSLSDVDKGQFVMIAMLFMFVILLSFNVDGHKHN